MNTLLNKYPMESKFLLLGKNDLVKGVITAFLGALIAGVYQLLNANELSLQTIKPVLIASASAGLGYLIKNWLTNSNGQPFHSEPIPDQPDGNDVVIDNTKNASAQGAK